MDKSKQGKLPASPMGDFGPPGSGRPQPLGSLHRRNESVTTDSSYSYAGLLQNSSPLLPDTPTRPPRYPSSNDGNSLQTTALESSLGGQLNLQISRQQNLVSGAQRNQLSASFPVNERSGDRNIPQPSMSTQSLTSALSNTSNLTTSTTQSRETYLPGNEQRRTRSIHQQPKITQSSALALFNTPGLTTSANQPRQTYLPVNEPSAARSVQQQSITTQSSNPALPSTSDLTTSASQPRGAYLPVNERSAARSVQQPSIATQSSASALPSTFNLTSSVNQPKGVYSSANTQSETRSTYQQSAATQSLAPTPFSTLYPSTSTNPSLQGPPSTLQSRLLSDRTRHRPRVSLSTLSSTTSNPERSQQQGPSNMAAPASNEVALSTDKESLLTQLLEAREQLGRLRNSEAHAVRRADRYKKEAAKTRESLQALEELHEKAKVTISIQSAQLSGKVEPETPHRQRSLQPQATPQTYRNQHALVHQAAMAQPPVLQRQNSSNVSSNTQYGRPGPSYAAADAYSSVSQPPYPGPAHNQLQPPPQAPYEASAVVLQRQGSSNMSNTTQYTRTGPSYPAGDVFSSVSRPSYPAPVATQRQPPQQASYDVSRPPYPGPVATQLPPPPPQASYDTTAVVPHRQSAPPQQDFKLAFNEFFADIENWARKWASVPNPEADQKLTPSLKALLSSVCDRSIALLLLSDPATRYFLVARVISDELTHQLKITVIKGFNAAIDARVQQVKDELHTNVSVEVRRRLVSELADLANAAGEDPKHIQYLVERCQQATMEMLIKLAPLMAPRRNRAYEDLHEIHKKATFLAMNMLSVPLEWKIEFPKINELFVPNSMINRDPVIAGPQHQLTKARVKLAVTPVIIKRDQTGPSVLATQEHMAHVLLMY